MLPATCVVVPTYWTRAGGAAHPGDAVYDHPTPLDGEGTLGALLESLTLLGDDFYLLLLVAVTSDEVAGAAEQRVRDLAARYPSLRTLVFGAHQLRELHAALAERRLSGELEYLALRGYPTIRNLQLAVPLLLGAAAIVALDDDEIVTDPDFLRKAVGPLGTTVAGERVTGLSGHYLQENGSIMLAVDPSATRSTNLFDRKAAIMNAATEMLEREPGTIVRTPFCFGGNMEFSAELASAVGFDPGITRGEDIDYLINARLEGYSFFLRKDLRILHCPPKGGSYRDVSRSKLEQDVIRFLYERAKLEASQRKPELRPVTAEELMPYPGEFLSGEIDGQARDALEAAGFPGDAGEFVAGARADADRRLGRYLDFRTGWPRLTAALGDLPHVREALAGAVTGG